MNTRSHRQSTRRHYLVPYPNHARKTDATACSKENRAFLPSIGASTAPPLSFISRTGSGRTSNVNEKPVLEDKSQWLAHQLHRGGHAHQRRGLGLTIHR